MYLLAGRHVGVRPPPSGSALGGDLGGPGGEDLSRRAGEAGHGAEHGVTGAPEGALEKRKDIEKSKKLILIL